MGNPLFVFVMQLSPFYLLLIKDIMFIKKERKNPIYNNKSYYHKTKRYVINTDLHMLFFIPIYCTSLFCARKERDVALW